MFDNCYRSSSYDRWITTPPEEPDPVTECEECGLELFEGDTAMKVDDMVLCTECGQEHCLNKFSYTVEPIDYSDY